MITFTDLLPYLTPQSDNTYTPHFDKKITVISNDVEVTEVDRIRVDMGDEDPDANPIVHYFGYDEYRNEETVSQPLSEELICCVFGTEQLL